MVDWQHEAERAAAAEWGARNYERLYRRRQLRQTIGWLALLVAVVVMWIMNS